MVSKAPVSFVAQTIDLERVKNRWKERGKIGMIAFAE
jgi:hypothetical protein